MPPRVIVIMTLLGTVYAWSVFVKPVVAATGWDKGAVATIFMIIIGMIGLSAAFGGILVDKKGPKFVATLGVILYGIGVLLGGVGPQLRQHLAALHRLRRDRRRR